MATDKLFRIQCGYQNYDWGKIGSTSAVAQFAHNSDPSVVVDESKPYAELWMGTHPSVPSKAIDLGNETLRDLVNANPKQYLGDSIIKNLVILKVYHSCSKFYPLKSLEYSSSSR